MLQYPNGIDIKEEEELIIKDTIHWPSTAMISSSTSSVSHFPSPNLDLPADEPELPVPNKRVKLELANSYEWILQLEEAGFIAVPVSCFKHVSKYSLWFLDNMM